MKELTIKAIPTTYNGIQFRSKLEARWAYHLDLRQVEWQYEPATYELPNGQFYIPDFWIPHYDFWLEIKGPGIPGLDKLTHISEASGEWAVVGEPPTRGDLSWWLMDPPTTKSGWADQRDRVAHVLGEAAIHQDLASPFPADVPKT